MLLAPPRWERFLVARTAQLMAIAPQTKFRNVMERSRHLKLAFLASPSELSPQQYSL